MKKQLRLSLLATSGYTDEAAHHMLCPLVESAVNTGRPHLKHIWYCSLCQHIDSRRCATTGFHGLLFDGHGHVPPVVSALGAAMLHSRIMHILLITGIGFHSDCASAADCQNLWNFPASQSMTMDAGISFSLTDYKNGERHFSAKDSTQSIDIYYLKGAVLVKGYSQAQMEKFPATTLFMMPMAFTVPIAVLSEAVPKGPCSIEGKASFSVSLSGSMRLQDRKLTNAVIELVPSASGEVSYQLNVSIDPPDQNKTSVRYSGTMSFVSQQDSPSEETDVTGYLLVMRLRPFPVAGSAGVPAKLGDLRRFLSAGQVAPKPALQETLRDNDLLRP